MTDPYRKNPMSDLDLLNARHLRDKQDYDKLVAYAGLKHWVAKWKDAKTYKHDSFMAEGHIQNQISKIKEFEPDFSFEKWLENNY